MKLTHSFFAVTNPARLCINSRGISRVKQTRVTSTTLYNRIVWVYMLLQEHQAQADHRLLTRDSSLGIIHCAKEKGAKEKALVSASWTDREIPGMFNVNTPSFYSDTFTLKPGCHSIATKDHESLCHHRNKRTPIPLPLKSAPVILQKYLRESRLTTLHRHDAALKFCGPVNNQKVVDF